ncbi:membrane protein [Arthrobacter phage Persistence]|uniref:Membrane protein n=1 Tax=Arthrobacter phage Persistence TaxID=2836007 RepID=A0A8F3IKT7_9CAUD|nr:membrane protein [Arthrobacter phage Persistence]QWY79687.1 membrane protein [Arthrobacter phage Persistence]
MNQLLAVTAGVLLLALVWLIIRLISAHKRTASQQPPKPEFWEDRHYAHATGYTLSQWAKLQPEVQRKLRNDVSHYL